MCVATTYIIFMQPSFLIRDIPQNSKPRERLAQKGTAVLSDVELLAIILSTGGKNTSAATLAQILIKKYGNLKSLISQPYYKLIKEKYIGIAKATTISASFEIAKRIYTNTEQLETIKTPKDVYNRLTEVVMGAQKENLFLFSLDSRKTILGVDLITIGTVNEALFPIREIIIKALERNAITIVIAHNHPSNDVEPSTEDIQATQSLDNACKQVGLTLLDHVIVSDNHFFSLKSANLLEGR